MIGSLRQAQVMSIILFTIGVLLFLLLRKRTPLPSVQSEAEAIAPEAASETSSENAEAGVLSESAEAEISSESAETEVLTEDAEATLEEDNKKDPEADL